MPPAAVVARADPTRIAVLEYELLGIAPEAGSVAAATIALRRAGTCLSHNPVDVSTISEPGLTMCGRCGCFLVLDGGVWVVADVSGQGPG
ncbi:hypothetical protein [Streptomyces capuensis]|uniref:hypothetical protein n=1 Tax=Streptomyces capuensis TaxID=1464056 RepID=UPI000A8DBCAE|nr:hypothetical protein [Streptomyces capuensis]